MKLKGVVTLLVLLVNAAVSASQVEKIVVTGSRIDTYGSPAITLVKPADFLIQRIVLVNDSRDEKRRVSELHQTVKAILKSAKAQKNIEISVGDEVIYPISLENFQLDLLKGKRPDTNIANLLIKTPIESSSKVEALVSQLDSFIKDANKFGRTEIEKQGELILSIVNPQKYRNELLKLIALDVNTTIGIFGENYMAEIDGVSESLQWERASISELRLFLEYSYVLVSK